MKEKFNEIVKKNGGYIVKDVEILGNIYCLKQFDDTKKSLETISLLYSDYYSNCCMLTPVAMNKDGYKKKLEIITKANITDGFTYWHLLNQNTNITVGLFGFKKIDNVPIDEALDLTLMTRLTGIVKPLCMHMFKFLFENFDIKELRSKVLSYNRISQLLTVQIGLIDNGITRTDKDYVRDSYILNYLLTRERYNKIKEQNNGEFKVLNIPRKTDIKFFHCGARTLKDAIEEFEQNNDFERLEHCKTLQNYLCSKYPRMCKL